MYLGQGITSIIHIFSPERVIIGGGLSNAFDQLAPGIHEVIRRDAMPFSGQCPSSVPPLAMIPAFSGRQASVLDASGA